MITVDRGTVLAPARDGAAILDEVTLSVGRGERVNVVGANGAGKSTLLSVLASLCPLDSGRLVTEGDARVGLLLQEPDNQLVTSTVQHELMLSVPRGERNAARRVAAAAEQFGLAGMGRRHPHRLSGGEKQRLALATVWLQRPDILLLDEPTSFLDPPSAARARAFVRDAAESGAAAVVWAGPAPEELDDGRVVCLERGTVTFDGDVAAWQTSVTSAPFRFREPDPPPPRGAGPAVLEFDRVAFGYGDRPVFDGLNLSVAAGECVGIAGNNGSGKSTLLYLAGGVVRPSRGRVTMPAGRDAGRRPVFLLPQSPERLFFAERVLEELTFGLRRLGVDSATARGRAAAALKRSGLDPPRTLDRSPFDLSYGEMRRVAFAIAGVLQPSLLLLDEPTAGLDPGGVELFYALLNEYRAAAAGVLVASHDRRALAACDRVVRLPDAPASGH